MYMHIVNEKMITSGKLTLQSFSFHSIFCYQSYTHVYQEQTNIMIITDTYTRKFC